MLSIATGIIAAWRRFPLRTFSCFAPKPTLTYGSKKSSHYKQTKIMTRIASVRARRLEEERGLLLDTKKQLRMELKRNQGIGWYRSLQICKHLEMHERGKGPEINEATRDKITKIANLVKLGK
jgi:hypothetical protein